MPVPAPDGPALSRLPVVPLVAASCLLLQTLSAAFLVQHFETPNAAAAIARMLALEGRYVHPETNARAYHLPGEVLYLAAGFRWLPARAWRFLHVPVTMLLVSGIAVAGQAIGGGPLAVSAAAVAGLEPFLLLHGPVWDDAFLAIALEWTIFALLLRQSTDGIRVSQTVRSRQVALLAIVGVCAAAAAVTRLQSQLVLGAVGIAAIVLNGLRRVRPMGWAIVLGLVLGLAVWGVRNAAVFGKIVVGSTHDGKTLEESTGPDARQAIYRNGKAGGSSGAIVTATDEVEADRALAAIAWRYIFAHPADFMRTASVKIGVTLLGLDLGVDPLSPRNLVALASSLILLTAGTIGLRSLLGDATTPSIALVLASIVAITVFVTGALLAAGPVGLRYRLGLSALLYLGAGRVMLRLGGAVTARRRRRGGLLT